MIICGTWFCVKNKKNKDNRLFFFHEVSVMFPITKCQFYNKLGYLATIFD